MFVAKSVILILCTFNFCLILANFLGSACRQFTHSKGIPCLESNLKIPSSKRCTLFFLTLFARISNIIFHKVLNGMLKGSTFNARCLGCMFIWFTSKPISARNNTRGMFWSPWSYFDTNFVFYFQILMNSLCSRHFVAVGGYECRSSDSALGYLISKVTSQQHKILDKKSFLVRTRKF